MMKYALMDGVIKLDEYERAMGNTKSCYVCNDLISMVSAKVCNKSHFVCGMCWGNNVCSKCGGDLVVITEPKAVIAPAPKPDGLE